MSVSQTLPGASALKSWASRLGATGKVCAESVVVRKQRFCRLRHCGKAVDILQAAHLQYQTARSRTPSCWSGHTRNWQPVTMVTLDSERDSVDRTAKLICFESEKTKIDLRELFFEVPWRLV